MRTFPASAPVLILAVLSGCDIGLGLPSAPSPTTPAVGDDGAVWLEQHGELVRRIEAGADLVFLGDSITHGFQTTGRATWRRDYVPRNAANLGIGGDTIQNVLWRLDHGAVDGAHPEVVILLVGTNNLDRDPPEAIAEGVAAILDRLRARLPESRILLLGLFPRGVTRLKDQQRLIALDRPDERIGQVNALLEHLDDRPMVTYLDIGPALLDDSGMISKRIMPDLLHLSPEGYRRWAEAMEPTLWSLIEGG